MEEDADFQLRAPSQSDLEAVADVLAADDLDDTGQVVMDASFVRHQWEPRASTSARTPGSRARLEPSWGTGRSLPMDRTWPVLAVQPGPPRTRIGSALLDRLLERAPHLLRARPSLFRNAINSGDEAAADLLASRGLHLARHFWHMAADLPGTFGGPDPRPRGVEIAALRSPEELAAVYAALEEAFAEHWDHQAEPFERWAEQYTQPDDFDPSLWLVARVDGAVAGALAAAVRVTAPA